MLSEGGFDGLYRTGIALLPEGHAARSQSASPTLWM
jgi:hypothetical protein